MVNPPRPSPGLLCTTSERSPTSPPRSVPLIWYHHYTSILPTTVRNSISWDLLVVHVPTPPLSNGPCVKHTDLPPFLYTRSRVSTFIYVYLVSVPEPSYTSVFRPLYQVRLTPLTLLVPRDYNFETQCWDTETERDVTVGRTRHQVVNTSRDCTSGLVRTLHYLFLSQVRVRIPESFGPVHR